MEEDRFIPDTTHQQQAMEPSPMSHELPIRASRYSINLTDRISRNLGGKPLRGSTAVVYQGTLTPEGTPVAIKTFYCTLSGNEAELKRLFREVHTWSKLRHKNIVPMFGITTESDSALSIISEWMPLGNAYDYVQNKKNDPRPLLEDIANGLYYLHTHDLGPVVHGDLKGLNVLVSSNCRARLSDFGLSTLNISTFSMTVDVIRGGSYYWMAPELLDDSPVSTASDVWAFGMTALELFTGALPFPDCPHPANVLGRLMRGELPLRPADKSTQFRLTDPWWEICTSCWGRDPSSRPTMKDVMEKVKAAISQTSPAVIPIEGSVAESSISKVAEGHRIPWNFEIPGSDTGLGQLSECNGLENDHDNMNQSIVEDDCSQTELLPSLECQMSPSVPALEDESQEITEASMEDIIIAIMGPTGSGKSSFIDKVVAGGRGEAVGRHLTSYRSGVTVTRCMFEESSVVLVDTPEFDDTGISDSEVLEMVSNWLNEEYQQGTTLAAILWFHRITGNRMVGAPQKNLRVFEKLCGRVAMPKVVLVTTMWDEVDEDFGEERLKELKDFYWKMMISQGCRTFKYENTRRSARQLVRPIVCWHQETTQEGVQLQVEISVLELELKETAAGRELYSRLEELADKRIELLRKIRVEARAVGGRIPEGSQREYAEVKAQLDSILIRARGLMRFQRLWHRLRESLKLK